MRKAFSAAILLAMGVATGSTVAQTVVELRQDATRYNLQSTNGLPLSDVANNPPGSNGRAPGANPGPVATPRQFQGQITFGGLVTSKGTNLATMTNFALRTVERGLPRNSDLNLSMVLQSARIGAPYLSRNISFLFGAVIPRPNVDEFGVLLKAPNTNVNRLPTEPEVYWVAEPFVEKQHSNDGYYWSPNAKQVYAVNSGPVDIVWRKAVASTPTNPPPNVGTVLTNGRTYTLLTNRYIISSSPVKTPRQMYWTEGDYMNKGKLVNVPTARIPGVKFVYNLSFPESVTNPVLPATSIVPNSTNSMNEKRTLWLEYGAIHAYNIQGRAFVELLGDLREDGVSRQHLDFEIVDVIREANPHTVTNELGERLTAFPKGGPDDSDLFPEPISNPTQTFAYQHNVQGSERVEYYGIRKTQNPNDLQVHWLEEGMQGLRWPSRLVRHVLVWPEDATLYSHYIRPLVATEDEARATAIPLPNENAPIIEYQDPLDKVRGKLTDQFAYYSFLSANYPAHRALIRFTSGEHVRFERVFSWLDSGLRQNSPLAGSVATNLSAWNSASKRLAWTNEFINPRVVTQVAMVGDRITAPVGEIGAGGVTNYLAGHIVTNAGKLYHPGAYRDPLAGGFEAANQGAIIPVNAIPGTNILEVLWFRKNKAEAAQNFKPVFWPEVIARYTIEWPSNPSEIVLASNDGSGGLSSRQANGSIYFQNDPKLAGYNPNEEHALMLGGQAYALRDDLNETKTAAYSSAPFVLLDYIESDGRPAIRAFKVLREKPEAGITFDYPVNAGTVLQAPMPLPYLEKPLAPRLPGEPPRSFNEEMSSWTNASSSVTTENDVSFSTLTLRTNAVFGTHRSLALHSAETNYSFFVIHASGTTTTGVVSRFAPAVLGAWTLSAQTNDATHWKYAVLSTQERLVVDAKVLLAAPANRAHWTGTIQDTGDESGVSFVVIKFAPGRPPGSANATLLINPLGGLTGNPFAGWTLSSEALPPNVATSALGGRYSKFTFQDRKGNLWVYRGPHTEGVRPAFFTQFYYKTLPGFHFPNVTTHPATGTITPYLRARNADGTPVGNAYYSGAPEGNALPVAYLPAWPENTPVLEMAETLTLSKRGLPDVRRQTSLEVLYQQSHVSRTDMSKSAVLHDPTREKQFLLGTNRASLDPPLGMIPESIATSVYRGRTYFPNLPPHLVDRFFFDPNRGANGALVFKGEFVDAPLGDKYLHLNVLGVSDMAELKTLCSDKDPRTNAWYGAISNLATRMEIFIEDTARPGTYIPDTNRLATNGPIAVAEITDDDLAVDSYAFTAVGPGTGYVTLLAANGRAFTPEDDPVSVEIIRVVPTLYRGEVNVVESSNPLSEKLTLQQVVDLAGQPEKYKFEWMIAPPVDGLPPVVYSNAPVTLLEDGGWKHVPFPLATDFIGSVQNVAAGRKTEDVSTAVSPVSLISFNSVSNELSRFYFQVSGSHPLVASNQVTIRKRNGEEVFGTVLPSTANTVVVTIDPNQPVSLTPGETNQIHQLYERVLPERPQSLVYREFTNNTPASYSQIWLSLDLNDSLGARIYLDGQLLVTANLGGQNTPSSPAPASLTSLSRAYLLPPSALAGGVTNNNARLHRLAVELYSGAIPGATLAFNVHLDAMKAEDVTALKWLPLGTNSFQDGVRAVLGGPADVQSLSDNYLIMRYQAKEATHASWVNGPNNTNVAWSQWTTPQLAEGWIKRVLKGINPFNQRVTDLFNNQVSTEVSLIAQAGARWEGNVALNLDAINDAGLIEIYETVLRRGRMLSIDAGYNMGAANDALLLAAGYLNDLYMFLGNEAWSDAANPTIGIGTKDNTYGDIATALFSFKGQLPSVLDEELALLRGRDDFLLPGVELRPLYNRLPWNFTRGIDAGEVIYALNYNILDKNRDGVIDAEDARKLYPQGHGDAYGHYLTALKGYYSLIIATNFTWVPRSEAVTVLGKPVSVDYQDERKFAAAAAALARAGKQTFDLTWRKDFRSGSGEGWTNFASTRPNSTTRNLETTRFWGMDHWASRTGQGSYLNWIVGNAILPEEDTDPAHHGTIQQVDRTTVPELKELPAISESLQTALDNAEAGLTPLAIPANTIPFDLNPLSIANGQNTTHFEQIYERAREALNNAVVAFDDAKDVTRLMRSEEDSLAGFDVEVQQQEMAYNNSLIELYGSPYPEDIGPGRSYSSGYAGPDIIHYMYVDNQELAFGSLLTPQSNKVWRVDVQTFTPDWLDVAAIPGFSATSLGYSDFNFIVKARNSPVDGIGSAQNSYLANTNLFVEYNLASHGFFQKPTNWVGRRATPGKVQQAASDIIKGRNAAYEAFYRADASKRDLDWTIVQLAYKQDSHKRVRDLQQAMLVTDRVLSGAKLASEVTDKYLELLANSVNEKAQAAAEALPLFLIAGLAAGGDFTAPARGAFRMIGGATKTVSDAARIASFTAISALEYANETIGAALEFDQIAPEEWSQELRDATSEIRGKVYGVQNEMTAINHALQELDDARRAYQGLLAEGERIQAEREVFRQRAAAIIQGFRTRDAAFRIFRNEKLERYKTLFDLAARYTYMAAQSFDYDTGLLHTQQGREFLDRIIRARALGVMPDGEPQFAGSNTGDPGLSSVMAEMKGDWAVLKGRLGFKNPDAYGTTASLRFEHFRILPGQEGAANWVNVLNAARKANILEDTDVRRYCMQIDPGNGLPVPGFILEFSTAIADGLNLFGKPLAPGDHSFSPASFATKIFGVGVALQGYKGMDDPSANGGAITETGAASPADPTLAFLDSDAMAANPYVYLIPVGLDSMRSPPLGDTSVIRTWSIDDVSIPLPFNIGGSGYSTANLWGSSDSLTEPLFTVRKHQPFRPVSSAAVFGTLVVYWTGGELERSQYNNTRLLGRSAWNSKWKLVIPGRTLLNNPNDGMDRFVRSVSDIKLYFMTYSYAGN